MAITDPIRRLGGIFAELSLRYVPNPYVLVILLTVIAFGGAIAVGSSPTEAMTAWTGGVWTLLGFMAAFAVTLMMGDAIAKSPAVTRFLARIAKLPSSPFTAVAFVSFVGMIAGLISWGLGLIVGAVMAKQVAYQGREKGMNLHYPLLAAAGYTALMIWHSGLTTSSGLIMADPALIPPTFEAALAQFPNENVMENGFSLGKTIGHPVNLVTVGLMLVVIPPLMGALHPKDDDEIKTLPDKVYRQMAGDKASTDGGVAEESKTGVAPGLAGTTFADKLNNSKIIGLVIALFPLYYVINAWIINGQGISSLTLNSINAMFIFLAMILWVTPKRIVQQMDESVENVGGIIFQFPFYAGISGLLTGTALTATIANFFASIATPTTWPVIGLISAGIVNIFVPSGGGQWVAQGPILLDTTAQLGMPLETAILIEMMGDQLTNMVQPFWALPLLALANLRARDIIGYSTVAMVGGFIIMAITMTVMLGLPAA
ncbi:TIGR00366 family protein [Haladaptatus sp. DJG-WS-42]|uniref:TIGR00366 family protein n=1 Tax=Haladaptatus sp. DJG-WS-42 TaxID=3120516 RepID=UPI0030D2B5F2